MKIAILGATGAVGQQMLQCLEERKIEGEVLLLASKKSAGKKVAYRGGELTVGEATDSAFAGCDYVLGAAENDIAKAFAPAIKAAGATFIDNSSAFRMDPDVPLIVPEINAADAKDNHGIISNPNCSTIIACMALKPICDLSPITKVVASTYQAVSGAGVGGMAELEAQMKDINTPPSVFPYQIAFNCIPCIGSPLENGFTTEEMKMQNEGRKIMHLPDMNVTCSCVRVPVMRSHSISLSVQTREPLTVEEVRKSMEAASGVVLVDDVAAKRYPMPIETSNQDLVYVGRIRKDLVFEGGITLWCCGDQIRKGAATNAVQILEACLEMCN